MMTAILIAATLILAAIIFVQGNRIRQHRQDDEVADRVLKDYIAEAQELREKAVILAKKVKAGLIAKELAERKAVATAEKLALWQTTMQTILKRFEGYGYRNKKGPLERGEGWAKLKELAGCPKSTK